MMKQMGNLFTALIGFLLCALAFEFAFRAAYDFTIPGEPDWGQMSLFAFPYFSLVRRGDCSMFKDFQFTWLSIYSYSLMAGLGYSTIALCRKKIWTALSIIASLSFPGLILRGQSPGAWLPVFIVDEAGIRQYGIFSTTMVSAALLVLGGIIGAFGGLKQHLTRRGFEVVPPFIQK